MSENFQLITTHNQKMLGEEARPNYLDATYPDQVLCSEVWRETVGK